MQCCQFAFVCIYMYICICPSHFNCVGVVSVVSSPYYEPRSTGDHARVLKRKQRDTASEESKAKEKESDRWRKKRCIQGESRVTLHLAHFLKLFRPPLGHLHCYLHGYLLAYLFCARHILRMHIPSSLVSLVQCLVWLEVSLTA